LQNRDDYDLIWSEEDMPLSLNTREKDGVIIVDAVGRITLGQGLSADFRKKMEDLFKQGKKKILLNLVEICHIDSSGLGELVCAFTKTYDTGGQFKLITNPRGKVMDLLYITKLESVFEIFGPDEEEKATRSFN
jgi:anti-sigma B factor antagonist